MTSAGHPRAEGPERPVERPRALVGRDAELAALTADIQAAAGGRTRVAFIGGEPGIGKTRLAAAAAEVAAEMGARAVFGRAYHGEGAPALWPWAQALRSLLDALDGDAEQVLGGEGAQVLAQAIPAVAQLVPEAAPPMPLSPGPARFRLFQEVGTLLDRLCRLTPALIVLEDMHRADTPTLLLLEFLASELSRAPLALVATYRDDEVVGEHPLARSLSALAPLPHVRRITLTGLPPADMERYLGQVAGGAVAPEVLASVVRRADGNPFFASEIVRLLGPEGLRGGPTAESRMARVPEQVRAVIVQRLARLSAACRQALDLAAVTGTEFDLEVLERAGDMRGEELVAAVGEAAADRLLVETPHVLGRYSFVHALVRETLYEQIPAQRRVRLHALVGAALDALRATGRETPAAELAHHFSRAAVAGDPAVIAAAVEHEVAAGEQETARLAYEQAVEHLRTALRLAQRAGWDESRQAELLLALGDAHNRAGATTPAMECFLSAARVARARGEPAVLARAALGYRLGVATGFEFNPPDATLLTLLEEALRRLDEGDSELRAGLLARLAVALYFSADASRRRAVADEAVAMARRLGDQRLLAETLIARHLALWSPAHVHEQLATVSEMVRIAVGLGDRELELQARYWRVTDSLELGDVAAVEADSAAVERLALQLRQPIYIWWATLRQTMRLLMQGRFAEAEAVAGRALEQGLPLKEHNAIQIFGAQMLLLRWEQGRMVELETTVAENALRFPDSPAWRCALAFIESARGRVQPASRLLEQLTSDGCRGIPEDFLWGISVAQLAEVAADLGAAGPAAVLYDLLLPYSGRWVPVGPAAACLGPVDRFLGRLAQVSERWEAARGHLEAALDQSGVSPPWEAHCQHALARMHVARGLHRVEAAALAQAAHAAATTMGMTVLAERTAHLLAPLETPDPAGTRSGREALTRREREVCLLARQGLTAREIGRRLFISERTVETHLANVYGKLGITSRFDLMRLDEAALG